MPGRVLGAVLVVGLLAGCVGPVATPPAPDVASAARPDPAPTTSSAPAGSVVVAQPDPVGVWWQEDPADVAAGDLAPLWTLPLYRVDDLGRWRPALATDSRAVPAADGWAVEVDLAAGNWSDGTVVGAADVVATATALAAARPADWGAWRGAVAVDDDTVRLEFDRPFAGWQALLSRPPGVLPAHVLEDVGLDAYRTTLPVTGGWFTLDGHEPGLRSSFTAHVSGALGRPGLEAVEVLVVPSHETALGLLERDEADAVLGQVVFDGPARRAELTDVTGVEVFGGTRFELVWPDGAGSRDVRRAAAGGLDPLPFVEGLLRAGGRPPGGVLPFVTPVPSPPVGTAGGEVVVQLPRTVEGLGLLARRLQADLQAAGVTTALVRLDPPEHLAPPVPTDARLRVVRVDPARSLAGLLAEVGLDPEVGLAADAAGVGVVDPMTSPMAPSAPVAAVQEVLEDDPRVVVLAEVAVTHVWRPDAVSGLRPSAWPGSGFWNVGEWRVPPAS